MYTFIKIALFAVLFFGMGKVSEIEFKEEQADENWYVDANRDGIHDSNCVCGYCLEVDSEYDYNINVHNDTVWLYDGNGNLIIKGDFDSISEFIINDNI